jgi:hypothetical protein
MRSVKFAVAVVSAVLSMALVAGPMSTANAAQGDPYNPTIPTKCKAKVVGKAKITKKKIQAGKAVKVRVAVKENSPDSAKGKVKVKLVKKGKDSKAKTRYSGSPKALKLGKAKPGKATVKMKFKPKGSSSFKSCSATVRLRVVRG